jgi:hypothetical protein
MRVRWAVALGLCSCNQILGVEHTHARPPVDAQVFDAPPLLVPPDGGASCATPVDFTGWVHEDYAPADQISAIAFFANGQLFARPGTDALGTPNVGVWESDLGGTPSHLAPLDTPGSGNIPSLGVTPDGNFVWLQQSGVGAGVYVASRASAWTKQVTGLGLINVDVAPGSVGYYDGTARMVVSVLTSMESSPRLVEVASHDGLVWQPLDTITFAGPALGERAPTLSADGCVLVFQGEPVGFQYTLYAAYRDASGAFSTATMIATPSTFEAFAPSLAVDLQTLWYLATEPGFANLRYVRAHPP